MPERTRNMMKFVGSRISFQTGGSVVLRLRYSFVGSVVTRVVRLNKVFYFVCTGMIFCFSRAEMT